MSDARRACPRCKTPLVSDAQYCHACGVSVVAAVSGEYELYDLDRFFTYAIDLFCIAGVDGYFKRVNPAFERTLGYSTEELLSVRFTELLHPEDRTETLAEVRRLASGRPTLSFENRYRCKDGSYRHLQWTAYPEPGTGLLYAVARDVTDLRHHFERTDELTGLATRQAFDETLPVEWSRASRLHTPLAIALFDVDHFRTYNERFGHDAGDAALRRLAGVLQEHARRAGDLVARYSGQQFALLLQGGLTLGVAAQLCDKIRRAVEDLAIEHPDAESGRLTVSAGTAAMVPAADRDHRSFRAAAERALATAKEEGRNRVAQAT